MTKRKNQTYKKKRRQTYLKKKTDILKEKKTDILKEKKQTEKLRADSLEIIEGESLPPYIQS